MPLDPKRKGSPFRSWTWGVGKVLVVGVSYIYLLGLWCGGVPWGRGPHGGQWEVMMGWGALNYLRCTDGPGVDGFVDTGLSGM